MPISKEMGLEKSLTLLRWILIMRYLVLQRCFRDNPKIYQGCRKSVFFFQYYPQFPFNVYQSNKSILSWGTHENYFNLVKNEERETNVRKTKGDTSNETSSDTACNSSELIRHLFPLLLDFLFPSLSSSVLLSVCLPVRLSVSLSRIDTVNRA